VFASEFVLSLEGLRQLDVRSGKQTSTRLAHQVWSDLIQWGRPSLTPLWSVTKEAAGSSPVAPANSST
jgi:hypothetical protein